MAVCGRGWASPASGQVSILLLLEVTTLQCCVVVSARQQCGIGSCVRIYLL